jgi:CheY-like chemotaxis protein
VLVVDDDAAIAAIVRECLRDEGYRVACARTMPEALAALTHLRVQLVLADTMGTLIGTGHGWERLEDLREAAGGTPLVLFTAHSGAEAADYTAHGFQEVLLKPFDLDDLVAVVARHILSRRPPIGGTPPP